jgi:hypothetical protein
MVNGNKVLHYSRLPVLAYENKKDTSVFPTSDRVAPFTDIKKGGRVFA